MTTPIDDDMLIAYADGELSEEERARVEVRLAKDPEAQAFVERLKLSAALAIAAYEAPINEAPPQKLVDAIMNFEASASEGRTTQDHPSGRLVTLQPKAAARRAGPPAGARSLHASWQPVAVAAALALLVGAATGYGLRGGVGITPPPDTGIALGPNVAASTLADALQTAPSGTRVVGVETSDVLIVATFKDRAGRVCREFEVVVGPDGEPEPRASGVACRRGTGVWGLEGFVALGIQNGADATGYVPSGDAVGDALDLIVTALGAGPVLTADEEKSLIESGWQAR